LKGKEKDARLEKDVLGLEIAMNDLGLLQHRQSVEELSGEDAHERGAEPAERVLLDELIEVVGEELEDEAEMRVVDKRVLEPKHVVLVVLVPLIVDLRRERSSTLSRQDEMRRAPHELQNCDLHHALLKVRRLVLDYLDRDNLVCLHVLTLDDLTERSLTQDVENEVPAKRPRGSANQLPIPSPFNIKDSAHRSLSSGPSTSLT
jgi:hypothetical protein